MKTDDEKIDLFKKHKGKKCYMWDSREPNDEIIHILNGLQLNNNFTWLNKQGTPFKNFEVIEEPQYRPYCYEDDILGLKLRYKHDQVDCMIISKGSERVDVGVCGITYAELLGDYTHLDGSPCGVKSNEEVSE